MGSYHLVTINITFLGQGRNEKGRLPLNPACLPSSLLFYVSTVPIQVSEIARIRRIYMASMLSRSGYFIWCMNRHSLIYMEEQWYGPMFVRCAEIHSYISL